MQLVKGANAPLMSPVVSVTVTGNSLDLCALLVTAAGRVRSDADLVFFNQPASACGQVRLLGATAITTNLTALHSDVNRPRD